MSKQGRKVNTKEERKENTLRVGKDVRRIDEIGKERKEEEYQRVEIEGRRNWRGKKEEWKKNRGVLRRKEEEYWRGKKEGMRILESGEGGKKNTGEGRRKE